MDGVPVLIRDIGEVSFGSANRFGAITGNGTGEKVMGQIMMLKDANSSEVIKNVKQRVAEVQHVLPEGLVINPFLERTELINKTTFTVVENLILGALIVIFVGGITARQFSFGPYCRFHHSPVVAFWHYNDEPVWHIRQPDEPGGHRFWYHYRRFGHHY